MFRRLAALTSALTVLATAGCGNTDYWVDAAPALGWSAQYGDAANSSYTARDYFHFDLKGRGYDLSEQVFWAKGEPWPFLVETPGATGVLVSHNW